jgi:putative hemolysin
MICIESVVEQRFPGLIESKPVIGKPLLRFLRFICHESRFQQFEQNYPHLEGFDFIEQVLHYFEFSFRVKDSEWERIPNQGRVVIVANHPIGSLDGLALLKMVGEVRRDVKVVANEILAAIKPLQSLLLPVDSMQGRTGKNQLKSIREHLNNEAAVIIFPAGEVSRMSPQGIRDGRWNTGFIRFAKTTHSPILPLLVDGRNSLFFYSLSLLAKPISTLWLIREMFKQAHNDVNIHVGHLVYPEQYNSLNVNPGVLGKLFKKEVYRLNKKHRPMQGFAAEFEAIAHPENRQLLKKEIRACEQLGQTSDGKIIYLYRYQCNSVVMREIGRLRELTFRAVKEGTGKRRDTDLYDTYYDHIILWDDQELEIAGAYRLVQCHAALQQQIKGNTGEPRLYTQTLFNFDPQFQPYLDNGLELGRSFVQPRYWGKRSIDYLWQGIGAYLVKNPDIRYMFGPVSISHDYPEQATSSLVDFYSCYFGSKQILATARNPYTVHPEREGLNQPSFSGENYREDFCRLKFFLATKSVSVPTLYKQYTELCEPDGAQFLAFNIDKDFADCVDGLILVDIEKVKAEKRRRYMESFRSLSMAS